MKNTHYGETMKSNRRLQGCISRSTFESAFYCCMPASLKTLILPLLTFPSFQPIGLSIADWTPSVPYLLPQLSRKLVGLASTHQPWLDHPQGRGACSPGHFLELLHINGH